MSPLVALSVASVCSGFISPSQTCSWLTSPRTRGRSGASAPTVAPRGAASCGSTALASRARASLSLRALSLHPESSCSGRLVLIFLTHYKGLDPSKTNTPPGGWLRSQYTKSPLRGLRDACEGNYPTTPRWLQCFACLVTLSRVARTTV